MSAAGRVVVRDWPDQRGTPETLLRPRNDIVAERAAGPGEFVQEHGPFRDYRRRVERQGDRWIERTEYRLVVPWMTWLFTIPVRLHLGRGRVRSRAARRTRELRRAVSPWWAPPDRLDERQVMVLGLLAAASMSSAFINTVFGQTVAFAADDFGVGSSGIGVAGSVVRAGIVIAIPLAVVADRLGRRRVITFVAWAAPIATAIGALAPSFAVLVVTQTVGRPLGLALGFLVAVVASEEVPRNTRAYAVSVLAMASGLGAGVAVLALPLADIDDGSWRFIFVVSLLWLPVAADIARRLPETIRFERRATVTPAFDRHRFVVLAVVAIATNLFVAPASFFQNAYLLDVRQYSGASIAAFTFATGTPAAIGLIIGGRIADVRGRRRVLAVALPMSTAFIVVTYSVAGAPMWFSAFSGGFLGSVAYPALAVYRTELFPTGNRSRVAGLLTATALIGGIGGLLAAGALLDGSWQYGQVMGLLALAQVLVVIVVLAAYPETAHRTLEDLNPGDTVPSVLSAPDAPIGGSDADRTEGSGR